MTEDDPRDKFRRLINSEDETHAEPPSQSTPPVPPIAHNGYPALDKDNMPLPRRVTETDLDGTRVTPAAFETHTTNQRRRTGPRMAATPAPTPLPAASGYRFNIRDLRFRAGSGGGSRWRSRLVVTFIFLAFVFVTILLCVASLALYEYYSIASTLPSVS